MGLRGIGHHPLVRVVYLRCRDPGFSQAGGSAEINNGVGRFGALIADLLFNLFGRPAYLFTVMVFYFGWMIFREQKTSESFTRA